MSMKPGQHRRRAEIHDFVVAARRPESAVDRLDPAVLHDDRDPLARRGAHAVDERPAWISVAADAAPAGRRAASAASRMARFMESSGRLTGLAVR